MERKVNARTFELRGNLYGCPHCDPIWTPLSWLDNAPGCWVKSDDRCPICDGPLYLIGAWAELRPSLKTTDERLAGLEKNQEEIDKTLRALLSGFTYVRRVIDRWQQLEALDAVDKELKDRAAQERKP